jgi:hypothetical protein
VTKGRSSCSQPGGLPCQLAVEALAAEVLAASVRGDYRKGGAYTQLY